MRGLPYTQAMHQYLQEHQYKDPVPLGFRHGECNVGVLREAEVTRDRHMRMASDHLTLRSSVGCLPLTMQKQQPLRPSWGVCGREPVPARAATCIRGASGSEEDYRHSPNPNKLAGQPDNRDDWLMSPETRKEWTELPMPGGGGRVNTRTPKNYYDLW